MKKFENSKKLKKSVTIYMKNATDCHRLPQSKAIKHLNTLHLEAIELMLSGQTDTQIAKIIGVSRDSVCRWRNHNPHFKEALNQRRNQLWQNSEERLNKIAFRSLELLEEALSKNDIKTAVTILELLRLYEVKDNSAVNHEIKGVR